MPNDAFLLSKALVSEAPVTKAWSPPDGYCEPSLKDLERVVELIAEGS